MAKAKISTTSVLVAMVNDQNTRRDHYKRLGHSTYTISKIFTRTCVENICKISNSAAAHHLEKLTNQGMLTKKMSYPGHCFSWWLYTITDAGYKLANEPFGVSTNERK